MVHLPARHVWRQQRVPMIQLQLLSSARCEIAGQRSNNGVYHGNFRVIVTSRMLQLQHISPFLVKSENHVKKKKTVFWMKFVSTVALLSLPGWPPSSTNQSVFEATDHPGKNTSTRDPNSWTNPVSSPKQESPVGGITDWGMDYG